MPLRWQAGSRLVATVAAMLAALLLDAFAGEPTESARTPWTTSRVVGSPDPPPPFKVVRAFPNLKFEKPLLLARCPGSDRLFVGEQAGVLYSFRNQADAKAELFFDLRKELKTLHLLPDAKEVESVYGLAFHPKFEQNRQCFVCYTLRGNKPGEPNLKDGTRVSRFTVTETDPPRIDPASEEIVLTFLQGGHNGGDLHFGPDGMLYISTGDAASPNPPDPLNTGQDISDLLSSILRIDVDRKDEGKNYAIPKDNPFVGMKDARPEVWAYGFRNPWRMSFDRQTGELFVGDVGWELWEMVHRVEKGGNYGWSAMEGPQPIKPEQVGPTPIHPPLIELPHTIACSVTGGLRLSRQEVSRAARGLRLRRLGDAPPVGRPLRGGPDARRCRRSRGRRSASSPSARTTTASSTSSTTTAARCTRSSGTTRGSQNADFPTTLSQTGLFASVKDHQAGAPGWSRSRSTAGSGRTARRRSTGSPSRASRRPRCYATGKPIPGLVYWHNFRMHFPKDAVLMRTLSLAARRLETQLLHYDGVDWRAYTYAWRDDQTDADLVPADGAEKEVRDRRAEARLAIPQPQPVHVVPQQPVGICAGVSPRAVEPSGARRPEPARRAHRSRGSSAGSATTASRCRRSTPRRPRGNERSPTRPTRASRWRRGLAAYLHANCGHCHSDHGGGVRPAAPAVLRCPSPR